MIALCPSNSLGDRNRVNALSQFIIFKDNLHYYCKSCYLVICMWSSQRFPSAISEERDRWTSSCLSFYLILTFNCIKNIILLVLLTSPSLVFILFDIYSQYFTHRHTRSRSNHSRFHLEANRVSPQRQGLSSFSLERSPNQMRKLVKFLNAWAAGILLEGF